MYRVLLAGGGTAGHVNPALAIAEIIKDKYPDTEFCFAGNPDKIEAELVRKAGYRFEPVKIEGFQRHISPKNIKRNVKAVGYLMKSGKTCKKIIRDFKPDLVVGTGGYVSGPVVRAAAKLGIKTAVHEQNAYAGVTNKILAKHVDVVMLSVKEAKKYFDKAKKYSVRELAEKNYNIDLCGYPHEEEILPPKELIQQYQEKRASLNEDIDRILAEISSILGIDLENG